MSADPNLMRWRPSDAEQAWADQMAERDRQRFVAGLCPICSGTGRIADIVCWRCQ